MNQRRVTISDVAELAGVSYQTVSRVINNNPNVSAATRQRIQEIIVETDYRPSHIARSLVTARTATVGLVVPDISNPFFSAIALGAEQVAAEHGYTVLLCNTGEDASREIEVLNLLHERDVDGVIICGSRQEDEALKNALSHFHAAVLINRRLEGGTIPAVLVDDTLGGYLNTQHLVQIGHTAIGFLAGPVASYSGAKRLQGYENALADAGIDRKADWVQHCSPTVTDGEEATHRLLKTQPELSAIFCFNDLVAVGALRKCAVLGRRVPREMAIVGFDDIMLATLVSPALTTCHVPQARIGSQAVSMLLDCINDEEERVSEIVVKPQLMIRASTVVSELATAV
jgi:LacI family transcriptional regulator